MERLTVLPEENECRLDHVLGRLLPDMGLRGRRRLCEAGLASVNGRPAAPSRKMRPGEVVDVMTDNAADCGVSGTTAPESDTVSFAGPDSGGGLFPCEKARVILRTPHLAALFKPAAMHTEALAGKPGTSLQARLAELLGVPSARLLNRLDFPTSGLTVAALDAEGERLYRQAQDEGRTTKRYLALLEGELAHEMLAAQKLLLKNRSRVLVELDRHPDVRRHTRVQPLAVMDAAPLRRFLHTHGWTGDLTGPVTLAGCTILKGARHQIRAHCSALGFPLLGDKRYGAAFRPEEGMEEAFFLHHGRLILPGFDAAILPPWLALLEKDAARAAERWLKE